MVVFHRIKRMVSRSVNPHYVLGPCRVESNVAAGSTPGGALPSIPFSENSNTTVPKFVRGA